VIHKKPSHTYIYQWLPTQPGMCPGNSECWVFSAGTKVVKSSPKIMFLKAV
jgi:hypothetical protein